MGKFSGKEFDQAPWLDPNEFVSYIAKRKKKTNRLEYRNSQFFPYDTFFLTVNLS